MDPDSFTSLLSSIPASRWGLAILCAGRMAGIFFTLPFFASRLVPLRFRMALLVLLLLCIPTMSPLLQSPAGWAGGEASIRLVEEALSSPLKFVVAFAVEVLAGVCLGWFALIVLAAVRAAAALISDQIGFSLGGIMDPLSTGSEQALRTFHGLLAVLIFLSLDLHHAFLRALVDSFEVLPPGSYITQNAVAVLQKLVLQGGFVLFQTALSMALPVIALLFFVSMVQGILTRVVPQLEFFVFGFPLRVFVGIGAIVVSLPAVAGLEERLFQAAFEEGRTALGLLSG